MAKKRKLVAEEKEPEFEFVPPSFDEKEFILKDLYGTRVTLTVTVIAIVVGICAACLNQLWAWYRGLILLVVGVLGLKELLKLLRFHVDLLESKSMIGNYFMFLLLSLGVWILLINPPFM